MNDLFIITGATGGMGLEAVKHFYGKGRLLLLDISLDKLNNLKNEMPNSVDVLKFDITNNDDLLNLSNYLKNNGGFKYLLHFAGVSESIGNSELIYRINLLGTLNLLDAVYDYVNNDGVIVNTASMTGYLVPTTDESLNVLQKVRDVNFIEKIVKLTKDPNVAYGWSKKGVIELVKAEVSKWGEKQARILSISPGAILTPMVEMEMKAGNDQAIKHVISQTPVKRIGLPSDIINLVDFLISDKASFINGIDILIDGGVAEVLMKK